MKKCYESFVNNVYFFGFEYNSNFFMFMVLLLKLIKCIYVNFCRGGINLEC